MKREFSETLAGQVLLLFVCLLVFLSNLSNSLLCELCLYMSLRVTSGILWWPRNPSDITLKFENDRFYLWVLDMENKHTHILKNYVYVSPHVCVNVFTHAWMSREARRVIEYPGARIINSSKLQNPSLRKLFIPRSATPDYWDIFPVSALTDFAQHRHSFSKLPQKSVSLR